MKRPPLKPPTAESLAKAALHYLERYACSETALRKVLENRIRRAELTSPAFAADEAAHDSLRQAIAQIVDKYKKLGILNDKAFTEAKVNSLRREGRSYRMILQKLGAKGIPSATVHEAIDRHAEGKSSEDAELAAALTLAKRRKLGPFRKAPADAERKRKDLAILARAGYSLAIACKALSTSYENDDAAP